jgi:hypothetical protein
VSICTLWRRFLLGSSARAHERSEELEESLKVAEYRNIQAHDLLREALEDLIEVHVGEQRDSSDPDSVKEDQ